jgi:hypothetical protein
MSFSDPLQPARAARNAAKGALTTRLEQVREDLEARSIGGRIADKVAAEASGAATEVAEVARSNKPVIAGTLAALIAWIFRQRIANLLRRLFGRELEPIDKDEEKESYW